MRWAVRSAILGFAALAVASPLWAGAEAGESEAPAGVDCAQIVDDAERLRCYDDRAAPSTGGVSRASEAKQGAPLEGGEETPAEEPPSYLSRLWELDEASRDGRGIPPP